MSKIHERPGFDISGLVKTWVPITASDADGQIEDHDGNITNKGIAIRVAAAGDVTYKDVDGNSITMTLLAGENFPTTVSRILATGTDAATVFVGLSE